MSKISEALKTIADPANIYGKDIRKAIHDGIEACYDDVTSPALNSEAFKAAVQSKIDDGSIAAMTIREKSLTGDKLADETITKDKLGEDVQAEFSSLKEDKASINQLSLGIYTDGLMYIFVNGEPIGLGIEVGSSEPVIPESLDKISVVDGIMTILSLANKPTQSGSILTIS